MRKYKLNQLLEVEWVDIIQDPSWLTKEKAGEKPKCLAKTLGYYLKHDKEYLYISSTLMDTDRDVTTIPLGVVKKTTILQKKERKKNVKKNTERNDTLGEAQLRGQTITPTTPRDGGGSRGVMPRTPEGRTICKDE